MFTCQRSLATRRGVDAIRPNRLLRVSRGKTITARGSISWVLFRYNGNTTMTRRAHYNVRCRPITRRLRVSGILYARARCPVIIFSNRSILYLLTSPTTNALGTTTGPQVTSQFSRVVRYDSLMTFRHVTNGTNSRRSLRLQRHSPRTINDLRTKGP